MGHPGLDEIENRCPELARDGFHSLPRGRGARQRENSRADNRSDAKSSQIERRKRSLHQAIRMFRFPHQKLRAFGPEKMGSHWREIVSPPAFAGQSKVSDPGCAYVPYLGA